MKRDENRKWFGGLGHWSRSLGVGVLLLGVAACDDGETTATGDAAGTDGVAGAGGGGEGGGGAGGGGEGGGGEGGGGVGGGGEGGGGAGGGGEGGGGEGGGGAGGGGEGGGGAGGAGECVDLADGRCVTPTWRDLPVLEPDANGVHRLELGVAEIMLGDQRHCLRVYNGQYPGPTIETPPPGDSPRQVRVDLFNSFHDHDYQSLDGESCVCTDPGSGQSCHPGHHGGGTCTCTNQEGEACHLFDFNLTNLHAHGSHVRPDYAAGGGCREENGLLCRTCTGETEGPRRCFHGDDVLSPVNFGLGARYRWDIDESGPHHTGTQWYHPHIHGSTGIQVANGAAGAWIVRGAEDALPGIAEARERIMVFTTPPIGEGAFEPLPAGEPCDEQHLTINTFEPLGDTQALQQNFINGLRRPRIILPPGQIERWRFVSASFLDEVFIALFRGNDGDCSSWDVRQPAVRLTQIARDGLTLPRPPDEREWPFAPDYLFMAPGYRIDAILDGNQLAHGDTLCMVAVRFLQDVDSPLTGGAVGLLTPPTREALLERFSLGDLVGIVNVSDAAGPPTTTTPPDYGAVAALAPSLDLNGGTESGHDRCAQALALTDLDQLDQLVTLQVGLSLEGFDGCACSDHNINCRNFEDQDRTRRPYDRVLPLGRSEHWRVYSLFDGHPFHIHINPFLVCPLPPADSPHPNAKGRLFAEPPFAHWRDTYLVNLDRYADLIQEYKDYTGAYVFHCHKLNHEDHGMMELMRVCDPATESCDTLCDGGPCTWDHCAEGDFECERTRAATRCVVDPTACIEANLRCKTCDDTPISCPPTATCNDEAGIDGERRCVPR